MTPVPYQPMPEELRRFEETCDGPDGSVVRFAEPYLDYVKEKIHQGESGVVDLYLLNPTLGWADVHFVVLVCAALCSLRLVLSGAMLPAWKTRFSAFKYFGRKFDIVKPGKLCKFAENLWYAFWHTTALAWGVCVLVQEAGTSESPGWSRMMLQQPEGRWFWITTDAEYAQGSIGWPLLLPSGAMRIYYLTQIAFWISCSLFLRIETRRSDHKVFIIHHAATICLVAFSYAGSYWRIGVVVLILHDVVDTLLYWSKSLHYCYLPSIVTECSFLLFVFSYLVARLLLFPFYCVWPSIDPSYTDLLTNGRVPHRFGFPGGIVLPSLLCVLVGLHVYWFALIVRMVVKVLNDRRNGDWGTAEDIRSEDESDTTEPETEGGNSKRKTR
ncbi:longevity-assurance protein (LAG1) domain-containing protein [Toxoplasma gondii VAND]|uniref:Longevity-assurance protein (LAG1) domain-containing protein n=1 Tax=Toxoplasma gondii VAND TaxID=933077 RepID=A0A086PNN8_TOXGO|nr:longevity-assurance protein (LAG1) domain-containing protein [Toxoplasma gondii VAND]